jgi:hypothetical protein
MAENEDSTQNGAESMRFRIFLLQCGYFLKKKSLMVNDVGVVWAE